MSRKAEKEWPEHFNPKPGELTEAWPTVRTETFVRLVLNAIKEGPKTSKEIQSRTKLKDHQVGTALADLILWRRQVRSTVDDRTNIRRYFFVSEK